VTAPTRDGRSSVVYRIDLLQVSSVQVVLEGARQDKAPQLHPSGGAIARYKGEPVSRGRGSE
jgi:hypothetical protein